MAMQVEESIYNLIPREEVKPPKQAMYQSRFKTTVKTETRTNKNINKTMGPAKVIVPTTNEFLKKQPKTLPEKSKFSYPDADYNKPTIPPKEEKPLMGLKTTKNFMTTNAVENITSVPKKPLPKYVDTVKGATFNLNPSGLVPTYTKKKDFGQVPDYLTRRKNEVERAQIEYDAYVREHYRRGAMKKLTDAERQIIMDGLKKNWEEIHHMYLGLSVVTDTVPKKARKEKMEAEMKLLERDIELLEKHKVIYIANN